MSKDKEQLKELLITLKKTSLSLRKFLILYYGINIDSHGKLSHNDIKYLFPHIRRVSFEYVLDNRENTFNGNITCVFDSFNNPAFYERPNIKLFDEIEYIETTKESDKNLKNINRIHEYREVYKILKEKKQKNLKKEKILKEDRDYD